MKFLINYKIWRLIFYSKIELIFKKTKGFDE